MKKFDKYLTIVQENREPINEGKLSTFASIIALLTGLATSSIKGNELKEIETKIENLSDDYSLTKEEKKEYEDVIDKILKINKINEEDSKELKMNVMGETKYSYYKQKIKEILKKLKNSPNNNQISSK
jgi:hypothetical protein